MYTHWFHFNSSLMWLSEAPNSSTWILALNWTRSSLKWRTDTGELRAWHHAGQCSAPPSHGPLFTDKHKAKDPHCRLWVNGTEIWPDCVNQWFSGCVNECTDTQKHRLENSPLTAELIWAVFRVDRVQKTASTLSKRTQLWRQTNPGAKQKCSY